MSTSNFDRMANYVMENNHLVKNDLNVLVASVKVMSEIRRIGTPACADLDPLYQKWLAAAPKQ